MCQSIDEFLNKQVLKMAFDWKIIHFYFIYLAASLLKLVRKVKLLQLWCP